MLNSLLVFSRSFGTDPYSLRSADSEAVAKNADALWESLEALSALSCDPETVPPAGDLGSYRSQSRDFPRLLALEKEVAQISRRLEDEMLLHYPRAPVLLGV